MCDKYAGMHNFVYNFAGTAVSHTDNFDGVEHV